MVWITHNVHRLCISVMFPVDSDEYILLPPLQHPSAATNPKGPYLPKELTAHRPSLHSEYQKIVLEEALDAAITDLRNKRREAAATAGASAAATAPL